MPCALRVNVNMMTGRAARIANTVLGLWLFISIFVWPHTPAQAVNAAIVGLFVALTALSAWSTGPRLRLRLANTAFGMWLLVSVVAFPTWVIATQINSAIVGVLVFALSLVPQSPDRQDKPTHHPTPGPRGSIA